MQQQKPQQEKQQQKKQKQKTTTTTTTITTRTATTTATTTTADWKFDLRWQSCNPKVMQTALLLLLLLLVLLLLLPLRLITTHARKDARTRDLDVNSPSSSWAIEAAILTIARNEQIQPTTYQITLVVTSAGTGIPHADLTQEHQGRMSFSMTTPRQVKLQRLCGSSPTNDKIHIID
jgi:cation transport ATPase